jgi:hypothetical protein
LNKNNVNTRDEFNTSKTESLFFKLLEKSAINGFQTRQKVTGLTPNLSDEDYYSLLYWKSNIDQQYR